MRQFLSFIALLVIFTGLFLSFHYYDWGFPITKGLLFLILMATVWRLRSAKRPQAGDGSWITRAETVICILYILLSIFYLAPKAARCIYQDFTTDTHFFTQRSSEILFKDAQNPYLSKEMAIYGQEKKYTGYKHGPVMPFGYALSVFGGNAAYKASQFMYFLISGWLIVALAGHFEGASAMQKLSAALFAAALYLAPERFWFEVFSQGGNDMFSIFLLIVSIYLLTRDRVFFAGILAGLSFSAKIFPAYLWALLLFRAGIRRKFYSGFFIGLLPMAIFLLWSPQAFLENVFVFHAIKKFDSTSLYSIFPSAWHWAFPTIQLLFTIAILRHSYRKNYSIESIMADLLLLMITAQIFYREVHANHLINFVPILALLWAWKRHSLFMKSADGS